MGDVVPVIFKTAGSASTILASAAGARKTPRINAAGTAWEAYDTGDAANLVTGALPDALLTSNVPLKNASSNSFSGTIISATIGIGDTPNAAYDIDIAPAAGSAQLRLYARDGASGASVDFSGAFGQFNNLVGIFYITSASNIVFRTDGGTPRLTLATSTGLATFANSVTITETLQVGGGTAIAKTATYTAAMTQSIGTLAEYEQSITATGVAAGDVVALDIPSQLAGIVLAGVRTTTNAILVKFYNTTLGSLSLTGTIKARTFEV